MSNAEVAWQVCLAPSAISERLKRLKANGVIQGYEIRLDPKALGKPLLEFIFVTDTNPSLGFDTAAALSRVAGLKEVHKIAGDDCYLLKVGASGTDELDRIIEREINPGQSVKRVRTTTVLGSVAERPCLAGHDMRG